MEAVHWHSDERWSVVSIRGLALVEATDPPRVRPIARRNAFAPYGDRYCQAVARYLPNLSTCIYGWSGFSTTSNSVGRALLPRVKGQFMMQHSVAEIGLPGALAFSDVPDQKLKACVDKKVAGLPFPTGNGQTSVNIGTQLIAP